MKLLDIPEDFTDQEKNPYFDPNLRAAPRERVARPLKFAPKGKYKSIANQIRAEQRIEQLRREIEQGGQANVQEEDLQIKDGFTKVMNEKQQERQNILHETASISLLEG